jgi:hypothetical protein
MKQPNFRLDRLIMVLILQLVQDKIAQHTRLLAIKSAHGDAARLKLEAPGKEPVQPQVPIFVMERPFLESRWKKACAIPDALIKVRALMPSMFRLLMSAKHRLTIWSLACSRLPLSRVEHSTS